MFVPLSPATCEASCCRGLDAAAVAVSGATDDEVAAALVELARARSRLDAAEAVWVAEFDRRGLSGSHGCRDTAHFLARWGHAAPGTARCRVEAARTLDALPLV